MLHSNFRYFGFSNEDRLILAGQSELIGIQTNAPTLIPYSVGCDDTASVDWSSIRALELRMQGAEFEKCLLHLKSAKILEFLSIPISLLPKFMDLLPLPSLETLRISGVGKGKINPLVKITSVTRFIAIPGTVHFSASSFPNLAHLQAVDDKSGFIRQLVQEFSNLRSLTITRTKATEAFQLMPRKLEYLRLIDGPLNTLGGIEALSNLSDLYLQNLPKLHSIEPLVMLKSLREITIGYCNHILDLEVIASLQNLERILIFGSKIDKPKFLEAIEKRPTKLKECIINS